MVRRSFLSAIDNSSCRSQSTRPNFVRCSTDFDLMRAIGASYLDVERFEIGFELIWIEETTIEKAVRSEHHRTVARGNRRRRGQRAFYFGAGARQVYSRIGQSVSVEIGPIDSP